MEPSDTAATEHDGPAKRSALEQFGMLGAVVLGVLFVRRVPVLAILIGLCIGVYGAAVLVNVRGIRARFLVPAGIERRPNRFTPWITGSTYLAIGLGILGVALTRL